MSWMTLLGILLLIWVAYDLVAGKVWLHRAFERSVEPTRYWLTTGLWFLLALSCFAWGGQL